MENTIRPPIVSYIVTHNLTVSGATVTTTVTSPVAIIPLNGVPSGHYYAAVAAVNIVGQGESNQESVIIIGTCFNEVDNEISKYYFLSNSTSCILYFSNIYQQHAF